MAILNSPSTTIEIYPLAAESDNGSWIETKVSIEIKINEQQLIINLPSEEVSLKVEEFKKFISQSRDFISKLPTKSSTKKPVTNTYFFSPIEPNFDIELSSGAFNDTERQDGYLWIQFEVGLKTLGNREIMGDKISSTFRTNILNFNIFLNRLEQDIRKFG